MIFTKQCQEDVEGLDVQAPLIPNLEKHGIKTSIQFKPKFGTILSDSNL
jgi:hypothetical protein